MARNIFNKLFGDDTSATAEQEGDLQKSTDSVPKEALSEGERASFETPNRLFGDAKEALLKRIEKLEEKTREQEERMTQLQAIVDELLSAYSSAPFAAAEAADTQGETERTLYLSAPSADGIFADFSDKEEAGKSIYRLVTTDGKTGTFAVLSTVDAISTALISLSQFIKPACKIENMAAAAPRKIVTTIEGKAVFNGETWAVSRKATVRLE